LHVWENGYKGNIMKLIETPLRPLLFWDADSSLLDLEGYASYIVPRAMDRGNLEEVRYLMQYYGKERIKQLLVSALSLHNNTITFFANYYDIPKTDFLAFRKKQHAAWNL